MFSTRKKIFEGVSQVEAITLLVVCILLYTQPINLVYFSNTILGKLLIVTSLVLASIHSTFSGFCIAILIVVFSSQTSHTYEGMESGSESNTKAQASEAAVTSEAVTSEAKQDADASTLGSNKEVHTGNITPNKFRKLYCKDRKLRNEKGEIVEQKDISSAFKTVVFNKGECNPCDEECSFNITDTKERMNTEENLRPADSNSLPIVK